MFKRIVAIGFIFVCSALAWLVLAAGISSRTNNSNDRLRPGVASTWGTTSDELFFLDAAFFAFRLLLAYSVDPWKSILRQSQLLNA